MLYGLRRFGPERQKFARRFALLRKRLRLSELFADIVEDRRIGGPLYFCVVQRHGSPDILMLGQFRSYAEAAAAGRQFMADYLHRPQRPESAAA